MKASGLAAGKGVVVADSVSSAIDAVDTVSQNFGSAGNTIVVEERLHGEEVSVSVCQCVCVLCILCHFPLQHGGKTKGEKPHTEATLILVSLLVHQYLIVCMNTILCVFLSLKSSSTCISILNFSTSVSGVVFY